MDQLVVKAINLEPVERLKLVDAILSSLDQPDPAIEQAWVAEAEARYAAYQGGEIDSSNWNEIKKRHQP